MGIVSLLKWFYTIEQDGHHADRSRKTVGSLVQDVFEELDQFSLKKDVKISVKNKSCFLIVHFIIYNLSGAIKTNKPFVNT